MLKYKSFKGRKIDPSQKVMVYKNLHNGLFSVRQNRLVVAHVHSVILNDVSFKISESGRKRVITEKKKNVHAFIVGFIEAVNSCRITGGKAAITYNPYKFKSFVYKDGNHEVYPTLSQKVYCCTLNGLYIY